MPSKSSKIRNSRIQFVKRRVLGSWNLYAGQLCSLPASVSSLQPSLHHPADFTLLPDDDEDGEDGDGEPGDEDDLNEDDGDEEEETDDE